MRTETDYALGYHMEWGSPAQESPSPAGVLGRVGFLEQAVAPTGDSGAPYIGLPMVRSGENPFTEVWTSSAPVTSGSVSGIEFAHDGRNLFCCAWIPPSPVYRAAVRSVYDELFRLLEDLDYPHIFRMWNTIGDVNGTNGEGLEVYKDFCLGRAEAFENRSGAFRGMPAATGIGARGRGIGIHMLSTRGFGVTHIDNPRQVPAYRYPSQYGPKPPSFSRATHTADTLYVSGTASIREHQTVYPGDPVAQCEETFRNLSTLLSSANLARYGFEGHSLSALDHLKVYYRRAEDAEVIRSLCSEAFGPMTDIAYANVDICRSDLLVEIEGMVTNQHTASPRAELN